MTLEDEFQDFFDHTYKDKKVSEYQKRDIKMNFYSGAFIGSKVSFSRDFNKSVYEDATKWIESYINERLKEEGLTE